MATSVTMLAHALHIAANAAADRVDDDLVLAALLHDVGHIVGRSGSHGDPDHAELGRGYLRPWLPTTITRADPPPCRRQAMPSSAATTDYAARLSEASRITLAQQGGAFDAAACAAFDGQPHAARAVQLRRFDDEAKRTDVEPLRSRRTSSGCGPRWPRRRSIPRGHGTPAGANSAATVSRISICSTLHDLVGWTVLGTRRSDEVLEVDLVRGDETHRAWIPDGLPSATDHGFRGRSGSMSSHAGGTPTDTSTDRRRRRHHGAGVRQRHPTRDGEVLRFANGLGFVRVTNYGQPVRRSSRAGRQQPRLHPAGVAAPHRQSVSRSDADGPGAALPSPGGSGRSHRAV